MSYRMKVTVVLEERSWANWNSGTLLVNICTFHRHAAISFQWTKDSDKGKFWLDGGPVTRDMGSSKINIQLFYLDNLLWTTAHCLVNFALCVEQGRTGLKWTRLCVIAHTKDCCCKFRASVQTLCQVITQSFKGQLTFKGMCAFQLCRNTFMELNANELGSDAEFEK